MRTYTANLSRRLGPIFSEMAARAAALGPYKEAKDEVCVNLPAGIPTGRMVSAQPNLQQVSKAYKPAHGGYPTVKAQA